MPRHLISDAHEWINEIPFSLSLPTDEWINVVFYVSSDIIRIYSGHCGAIVKISGGRTHIVVVEVVWKFGAIPLRDARDLSGFWFEKGECFYPQELRVFPLRKAKDILCEGVSGG